MINFHSYYISEQVLLISTLCGSSYGKAVSLANFENWRPNKHLLWLEVTMNARVSL